MHLPFLLASMHKKTIWIFLVAIAAALLWSGKNRLHPRVAKPAQQNGCLSIREDTLDVAVLRTLLPGKRWKYLYTIDKHNCFAEKKRGRFFPSEYVFELCAWDTLQLPPIDLFKKGPSKNFSAICFRSYADSAGIRIPVGHWRRNPYLILLTDPLRRAPHSFLAVIGKDASDDLLITKLNADTLVIDNRQGIKNKQGKYDWGFKDLFIATK